ncbi:MAG: amino acid ABC transporter permease [Spiroplasma sp.]|nr:amino acid ABC transporter permease [Mycoplasmatales bacterium]
MKSSEVHYKDNLITKVTKKISIYFASGYIHLFRGTPMIVQSMIFFYGFASLGFKMNIIFAGIVIVSFNSAAYIAEIIRGGIEALDKGQYEAARSLGMTRRLAMLKVILPQSLKNSIPSLMNELIVNVKDTSVLSVIGVGELFYMSRGAASEYGLYLQAMVVAAIVYLILTMSLSKLFNFYLSKSDEKFAIASVSSPEVHSWAY